MSEELKEYRELYNKYFKDNNYNLLNFLIIDEIECQLNNSLKEEDYNKLFHTIKNCYLKSDSVDLWSLTHYCLENFDDLDNKSSWEIIDKC